MAVFGIPGLTEVTSPTAPVGNSPGLTITNQQAGTGTPSFGSPAAPSTQTTNNGINNTAGTAGYGMNNAQYQQGIQQEYGSAIQGAQNQMAGWNSYLPTAQGDINNTANASVAQANQQAQDNLHQLDVQGAGTQNQQHLSLAELADQIHGQNQGLMNQLGAQGAGFSSAALTGQQALQHAQNTQATNINTQANTNLANINAEKDTTNHTLTTGLQNIQSWKQQQLDGILNNYSQAMSSINQALGTAQGEEKARLALYGQAISQQAANALGNLQNVTQGAIQSANSTLANAHNAASPVTQFQTFQPQANITMDQSSPFASQAQSGNANADATNAPGTLAGLGTLLKNNQNG